MSDIVIVPTYDRPEYLWACLEQLFNTNGITGKRIWVTEDIHADKPKNFTIQMEMLATIREAARLFGPCFRYLSTHPHTTYGNSFNLLNALHEASMTAAEKVYIVEDDVLVTKDFFSWNDEVHEKFHPWVSCAGRLNRSLNFAMNGPDAMDESIKDVNACKAVIGAYNSWATCFSRQALDEIVSILPSYDTFRTGFEQDILIQNHMRRNKLASVWPFVERAFHFGWTSYHRCGRPITGNLEEKVKFIRKAVRSKSILSEMASLQDMDPFVDPTEAK